MGLKHGQELTSKWLERVQGSQIAQSLRSAAVLKLALLVLAANSKVTPQQLLDQTGVETTQSDIDAAIESLVNTTEGMAQLAANGYSRVQSIHQRATASAEELQEVVKPASLSANASATFSAGPSYVLNAGVFGNGGLHARVATVAPTATHAASTTAATTQPVSIVVAAAAAAAAAADSAAAVAAGSSGLHAASAATATDAVPVAGSVHPSASADDAKAKAAVRKRKQRGKQPKAATDKHGGEAGMKMYKAEKTSRCLGFGLCVCLC